MLYPVGRLGGAVGAVGRLGGAVGAVGRLGGAVGAWGSANGVFDFRQRLASLITAIHSWHF